MKINTQVVVLCLFWCSLPLVSVNAYPQGTKNSSEIDVASLSVNLPDSLIEKIPVVSPIQADLNTTISVRADRALGSSANAAALRETPSNPPPNNTSAVADREASNCTDHDLVSKEELEKSVRGSPSYDLYDTKLVGAAKKLVNSHTCSVEDFVKAGGWKRSVKYKPKLVYYIYCQSKIQYFKPEKEDPFELARR